MTIRLNARDALVEVSVTKRPLAVKFRCVAEIHLAQSVLSRCISCSLLFKPISVLFRSRRKRICQDNLVS